MNYFTKNKPVYVILISAYNACAGQRLIPLCVKLECDLSPIIVLKTGSGTNQVGVGLTLCELNPN